MHLASLAYSLQAVCPPLQANPSSNPICWQVPSLGLNASHARLEALIFEPRYPWAGFAHPQARFEFASSSFEVRQALLCLHHAVQISVISHAQSRAAWTLSLRALYVRFKASHSLSPPQPSNSRACLWFLIFLTLKLPAELWLRLFAVQSTWFCHLAFQLKPVMPRTRFSFGHTELGFLEAKSAGFLGVLSTL